MEIEVEREREGVTRDIWIEREGEKRGGE